MGAPTGKVLYTNRGLPHPTWSPAEPTVGPLVQDKEEGDTITLLLRKQDQNGALHCPAGFVDWRLPLKREEGAVLPLA